jgi:hypothetical protein
MNLRKRLRVDRLIVIAVSLSLVLVACGKKGAPTLRSFEKPNPVRNFQAVHREDEIILTWSYPSDDREGIKGFYIERAEIPEEEPVRTVDEKVGVRGKGTEKGYRNIAFIKSDVSSYIDRDFETERHYLYKIRAFSLRNIIGNDSAVVSLVPEILPVPPDLLSFKVKDDAVEIAWPDVSYDIRYNIYRRYEGEQYPVVPLNKRPLVEYSFRDKVNRLKAVYYTVRSVYVTQSGAVKDEGVPSQELEISPAFFVPSRPYGLKYVCSPQKVYLTWNENQEAWITGYRIYRKKPGEAGFAPVGDSLVPAFTDSMPPVDGTLYSVSALGPVKESALSEPLKVLQP